MDGAQLPSKSKVADADGKGAAPVAKASTLPASGGMRGVGPDATTLPTMPIAAESDGK